MKKLLNDRNIGLLSVVLSFITLTLIKIFPFYLGGAVTKLMSTHILAKAILVFPFIFALLRTLYRPQANKRVDVPFIIVFLIYALAQTVSIVAAVDIESYIRQLQNVLVHYALFYVAYNIVSEKRYRALFFTYLLGMGIFCIVTDGLFLLLGKSFLSLIENNIQTEMMALFIHNARMGRFNSYLVLDSFIPIFFLFYHFSAKRKGHTMLFIATLCLTLLFSYLSLFRTRFIQGLFALSLSFFTYFKGKRHFFIFFILIPSLLVSVYAVTKIVAPSSMNVLQRFLLEDKREDVDTIEYRYQSFQFAKELLKGSPFFGVGMGNYKTYIGRPPGINIEDRFQRIHYEETLDNPHSIFIEVMSETGLVGLFGYLALLCYFLYKDIPTILKSTDKYISSIIVLAWTLFLYGIFNPFNTVYIAGWYWFMRGYIQSYYDTHL